MRRVISDGHDMLPFSRFTHATQRHKALADASGKVIFRLPILMLVLQLFSRGSLMLIALSNSKYRRGQNGRNASCEVCRAFLCVI